jgi:hypothetical protein
MRLAPVLVGGLTTVAVFEATFLGLEWLTAHMAVGYFAAAVLAAGVISIVVGAAYFLKSREHDKRPSGRR